MTLPINHLIRTLDRCCGRWEFEYAGDDSFRIVFLNTGERYFAECTADGRWLVDSRDNNFLANRLNGLKRDDSGKPADDWEVIENPPLDFVVQSGDEWCCNGRTWEPFRRHRFGTELKEFTEVPGIYSIRRRRKPADLPADFDCVPEPVDEPLKAGDWVVTPEGIGFITRVDASFTDGTTTDPLPFRVKFNKGHTLCYASGELRRARPDEIPQPVNINACDNPSGPCACGAWHNESDKPCDGDSFTPGKPVEQAQPLQLREGAWYQLRKGLVVGPLSPNAHGTYKWIDPKTGMNWTDAGKWWRNGQESDNDIEREVPAPSEPTTEQLTDEQVSAELKSAGIDMQPAFERLHKMLDEHKQKQPDVDGWIEWHGGEMPVDGEQLVSRRCLDVSIPSGPYLASSLRWTHVGNRYDITHYRLVQPAPKYRPFASADEFLPYCHELMECCISSMKKRSFLMASSFDDNGLWHAGKLISWFELMSQFVFVCNRKPCGVEVK